MKPSLFPMLWAPILADKLAALKVLHQYGYRWQETLEESIARMAIHSIRDEPVYMGATSTGVLFASDAILSYPQTYYRVNSLAHLRMLLAARRR